MLLDVTGRHIFFLWYQLDGMFLCKHSIFLFGCHGKDSGENSPRKAEAKNVSLLIPENT